MQFREIISMALAVAGREQASLRADHDRHHDRRLLGDLGHDRDWRAAEFDRERDQFSRFEHFSVREVSGRVEARAGETQDKYENRRNITYAQALRYYALMEGIAREICLKTFDFKGQAIYNGVKTTAEPDRGRVQQELPDREHLHAGLRAQHYRRRRRSRAQRRRDRENDRETIYSRTNRRSGKSSRLSGHHLHHHRRAGRERDRLWLRARTTSASCRSRGFSRTLVRQTHREHRDAIVFTGDLQSHARQGDRRDAHRARLASRINRTISRFTPTIRSRARLLPSRASSASARLLSA